MKRIFVEYYGRKYDEAFSEFMENSINRVEQKTGCRVIAYHAEHKGVISLNPIITEYKLNFCVACSDDINADDVKRRLGGEGVYAVEYDDENECICAVYGCLRDLYENDDDD